MVALAAVLCGARAIHRGASHIQTAARKVFPKEFVTQLQTVQSRIPPNAYVLHLSSAPEYWYSRLWQRALYPRNETIVIQQPLSPQRVRELSVKYSARFAISAGNPPWDPGYLWKVDLGSIPGHPGETWFGELKP
jgi:hypothetical protein